MADGPNDAKENVCRTFLCPSFPSSPSPILDVLLGVLVWLYVLVETGRLKQQKENKLKLLKRVQTSRICYIYLPHLPLLFVSLLPLAPSEKPKFVSSLTFSYSLRSSRFVFLPSPISVDTGAVGCGHPLAPALVACLPTAQIYQPFRPLTAQGHCVKTRPVYRCRGFGARPSGRA